MPNKKVLAIIGGLVLVAALVLISDYWRDRPVVDDARIGKAVLEDDAAAKTSKIVITKGPQTVTLNRDDAGRWVVVGEPPFAASGKMVSSLIDSLTGAKYIRQVSSAKEKSAALDIGKGDKIALFGKETPLLDLRVGKSRQGGGEGTFVSLGGEDKAFLIDKTLRLEVDPIQWEMKSLLDIPKDAISKVAYFDKADSAAPAAVVARDKKEDPFKLAGLATSEKAKQSELDGTSSILAGVNFKNKLPPSAVDPKLWDSAVKTVVNTFDGRQYTLKIAREQKTLPAPATPPARSAKSQTAPKPQIQINYYVAIEAKGTETPAGDVSFVNGLGKSWVFQLDEYLAKRFIKERTAFLEKP